MDRAAAGRGRVAFVLKGYPRLSETFIAQEILALERRGLAILIVSLRHPTDRKTHPVHAAIRAERLYLPEYLYQEPARVWRGWRWARRQNGYRRAWRAWLADLWRDPTPNRVRRFGQALVLAAELPQDIGHLHAHFLHTPASVARYAALICGLGWTVSAHAKDIWTTPDWEKREKLGEAAVGGDLHRRRPRPSGGAGAAVRSGGAVLSRARSRTLCAAAAAARRARDGRRCRTLRSCCSRSVGRSPKKGYDDLLAALALLPPDLSWRFVHIGGGALAANLRHRAESLGLAPRIEWRGALRAARGAGRLSRGRPVCARRQSHRGRRPRRASQRAVGGAEPAPRLHRDGDFRDPGADRRPARPGSWSRRATRRRWRAPSPS